MTDNLTMTIRISPELKAQLGQIAKATRRSKSFLAAEAVSAYVKHELEIIEGIKHGLADVEAGRVIPHDRAMTEISSAIDNASSQKT